MICYKFLGRPIEIVVLLLITLAILPPLTTAQPSGTSPCLGESACLCDSHGLANCSQKRLSGVPLYLNPTIESLILDRNRIENLRRDDLANYPLLERLDLSLQAHALSLVRSPFASLRKLTTLILHGNAVHNLSEVTFGGLTALQTLDLSRTNLAVYGDQSFFVDLRSIVELRLSDNALTTIGRGIFDGIAHLRALYLDYNQLEGVPLLANLVNLEILDLTGNRIESISQKDFEGLRSIERLVLDRNPLTGIDGLSHLTNLKVVSLKSTRLSTVPSLALRSAPILQQLDLSGSRFPTLPPHSFDNFTKLRRLVLNGCTGLESVQNLAFNNLPHLTTLSLQDNHVLSSLAPTWISNVPRLGELRLDGCSLSVLPKGGLNVHKTLDISAKGNQWACGCENAFLAESCLRQTQLEGSNCGAVCQTGFVGQRVEDVVSAACKSTNQDARAGKPSRRTLYLALAVLIPLLVLTLAGILIFVYRNRLRVCCGKSTAACLCRKSSSFQSKQPLVTMANWRQFTAGPAAGSGQAPGSEPPAPEGQTPEPAPLEGDKQTGEKPPYRIIAEYPIPITEL